MILCVDVGKGTEDILIYEPNFGPLENSIQLVLPSTAQLLSQKLAKDNSDKIVIEGELMAGEPWHKVIYTKCAKYPESVIMGETAARSLRYNLDLVREKGVKIVADDEIGNYEGNRYHISDIHWERIDSILKNSGINITEIKTVLLSCQDHGEPNDIKQSVRDFRIKTVYQPLERSGKLEDLLIRSDKILSELPRHCSIGKSAERHFNHISDNDIWVMDSSPAVVLGVLENKPRELIINTGNGHTLAAIIENGIVQGIFEIHTSGVDPEKFLQDIKLISQNKLTHDEVLAKGGHGVFIREKLEYNSDQFERLFPFTLIGPNRSILSESNSVLAHPAGNMMMAGPVGMLYAYNYKKKEYE